VVDSKRLFDGHVFRAVSRLIHVASAHDGEAEPDQSGRSVSLSSDGTSVAIGAPANGGNGSFPGHVRVYLWD